MSVKREPVIVMKMRNALIPKAVILANVKRDGKHQLALRAAVPMAVSTLTSVCTVWTTVRLIKNALIVKVISTANNY